MGHWLHKEETASVFCVMKLFLVLPLKTNRFPSSLQCKTTAVHSDLLEATEGTEPLGQPPSPVAPCLKCCNRWLLSLTSSLRHGSTFIPPEHASFLEKWFPNPSRVCPHVQGLSLCVFCHFVEGSMVHGAPLGISWVKKKFSDFFGLERHRREVQSSKIKLELGFL